MGRLTTCECCGTVLSGARHIADVDASNMETGQKIAHVSWRKCLAAGTDRLTLTGQFTAHFPKWRPIVSNDAAAERQKRLAQALRANLRKRKDQTRERSAETLADSRETQTSEKRETKKADDGA